MGGKGVNPLVLNKRRHSEALQVPRFFMFFYNFFFRAEERHNFEFLIFLKIFQILKLQRKNPPALCFIEFPAAENCAMIMSSMLTAATHRCRYFLQISHFFLRCSVSNIKKIIFLEKKI